MHRYDFRIVYPLREDLDYVTFALSGASLAEVIASADDDLPWQRDTILEVKDGRGNTAHIVMGEERRWRFADLAYTLE